MSFRGGRGGGFRGGGRGRMRGGGRGGEYPRRRFSPYEPSHRQHDNDNRGPSAPPRGAPSIPRVPVRANARGMGPDGRPFELSFDLDIPLDCLQPRMMDSDLNIAPRSPDNPYEDNRHQQERQYASAPPRGPGADRPVPPALRVPQSSFRHHRQQQDMDDPPVVIPTQPDSPHGPFFNSRMQSPAPKAVGPPRPSYNNKALAWLPTLRPDVDPRFQFGNLVRLFTSSSQKQSSSALDTFLALSLAMHSLIDLPGALSYHHNLMRQAVPTMPCVFRDVLAAMDQLVEVNCTRLSGEVVRSEAGPALDNQRTVLRTKWAEVGDERGLLTGSKGSEENSTTQHPGLPTDWVRLSCLAGGPNEEMGQYFVEHVMGLHMSITARCPHCKYETVRSTCDIPHAAEIMPILEVNLSRPKPLDQALESFFKDKATSLLPSGLLDSFTHDFIASHASCGGAMPHFTASLPNTPVMLGPHPPFLWISVDKTFPISNMDNVVKSLRSDRLSLPNGSTYQLLGVIYTYLKKGETQQFASQCRFGDRLLWYDNMAEGNLFPETGQWTAGNANGAWRFLGPPFPEHERWGISTLLYQLTQ